MARTQSGCNGGHQLRVIDRGAHGHGEDEHDRSQPHLHVQHPPPLVGHSLRRKSVIGDGLVGTAGRRFGQAAEDPVDQEKAEEQGGAAPWRQAEYGHFHQHGEGGEQQQAATPDNIGQGPRRYLGNHDGGGPHRIENRKLGQAQSEVQKQNRKDRVVEPAVEKDAKSDEHAHIVQRERRWW